MASIFRKWVRASKARQQKDAKAKMTDAFIRGEHQDIFGWQWDGIRSKEIQLDHSYEDYATELYKANGVVFSCVQALSKPFSEMRFRWQELQDGRPGDFTDGPGLELLDKPWPGAATYNLNTQVMLDFILAGNAYVVADARDRLRKEPRLRILRPDWVQIRLNRPMGESSRADVVGYWYYPGGITASAMVAPVKYHVSEVAHWMPMPDPEARYRGMSPLTPIIHEILSDKAATSHKEKFFGNAAMPSLTVALKETVTKEQFEDASEQILASIPDDPYAPMIFGGGADVRVVGADLKSIDFKSVQGHGETRIANALGVPAVLVGLSEAMQGSALNASNARVAKDIFIDQTLRPLFATWVTALDKLVTAPGEKNEKVRLWYDDRDVAFFRADRKELTEIISAESEVITRLTREGFTWDSSVKAVQAQGDWTLLEHSGLFSVQLWPPESGINNQEVGQGAQKPPAASEKPAQGGSGSSLAQRATNPSTGQSIGLNRKPPQPLPRSTRKELTDYAEHLKQVIERLEGGSHGNG